MIGRSDTETKATGGRAGAQNEVVPPAQAGAEGVTQVATPTQAATPVPSATSVQTATPAQIPALTRAAAVAVESLLVYGLSKGLFEQIDVVPLRNALLDLLRLPEPVGAEERIDAPSHATAEVSTVGPRETAEVGRVGGSAAGEHTAEDGTVVHQQNASDLGSILDTLTKYAAVVGLIPDDTITQRDLFDTRIMGILTPWQSEVVRRFESIRAREGIEAATTFFYRLCGDVNYIRLSRVARDRTWSVRSKYGKLEITINLSKPEKDPRDIAAARNAKASNYPKCLLCLDNVGYAGRTNHPARQNLRVLPLTLQGAPWYMQYSPYVYYNEHCIVFSAEHVPMSISRTTFARLLEFVSEFPHYFIGSNADLPIVGGSILSHDHFQGGRYRFPMDYADTVAQYRHPGFASVQWEILRWPLSTIRLTASDQGILVAAADFILNSWIDYSDAAVGVLSHSESNGGRTRHNTVTPIARRTADRAYQLDLVLRNNRTSDEHPLGIFHPHSDLHHIKKENIGLIEVMGLAILPGRLLSEAARISDLLAGKVSKDELLAGGDGAAMSKHAEWIDELIDRYGTALGCDEARATVEQEIGTKFERVLEDAGVFKQDETGLAAFARFMTHLGAVRV